MKFKIEKAIPLPNPDRGKTTWTRIVDDMKLGDSVLVNNRGEANNLRQTLRARGFQGTTRAEGKKIRVWKTLRQPAL